MLGVKLLGVKPWILLFDCDLCYRGACDSVAAVGVGAGQHAARQSSAAAMSTATASSTPTASALRRKFDALAADREKCGLSPSADLARRAEEAAAGAIPDEEGYWVPRAGAPVSRRTHEMPARALQTLARPAVPCALPNRVPPARRRPVRDGARAQVSLLHCEEGDRLRKRLLCAWGLGRAPWVQDSHRGLQDIWGRVLFA